MKKKILLAWVVFATLLINVNSFAQEAQPEPAPDFTLEDLEGNTVSLKDLEGKVVVLDFWATWCAPCIKSFPAMQMAVNKYKDDPEVEFLFINTWEQRDEPKDMIQQLMTRRG